MLKKKIIKEATYVTILIWLFFKLCSISCAQEKMIIIDSVNIKNSHHIKINNTLYIPVKPLFEAFGWKVHWDGGAKKIVCIKGKNKLEFINGSTEIGGSDGYSLMESPFIIADNVGYVPQKFVVQKFGVKVRWNKKNNIILLSSNNTQSISINGSSNIVIVGEGIIANIFEPCSLNTINDMLDIADKLITSSPDYALKKYEEVIENFSPEDMPDLYARIMNNIGNAYSTIAEYVSTKENIQKSIDSYLKAMEYFKSNGDITSCSTLMINLGNAYRILSDIDNDKKSAESSISQYNEALKYYTAESFSLDYGMILYNLGLSYNQCGSMELAADCWNKARDIYEKSLDTYSLIDDPQTYALINYNLGNIYRLLQDYSFEKSKQCYEQALNVWTPESFPMYYAKVNSCLGMLYSKMYEENKTYESLDNAKYRLKESLRFYTFARYPVNFAKSNLYLGDLYAAQYKYSNNRKLYNEAIACYKDSLKVFTPDGYQKYFNVSVQNMKKLKLIDRFFSLLKIFVRSV